MMGVICKKCGTDYKVLCHICNPPDYISEIEKIALEAACYRLKYDTYQDIDSALHSILMELDMRLRKLTTLSNEAVLCLGPDGFDGEPVFRKGEEVMLRWEP